ncbi:MAG: dipeptidase PepV [Oscillospiraceae bacterium]|nr:dipeptidase PepV [Oscillospiraceae bacterium]
MNLNERVLNMQDDLLKTLCESIRIPSVQEQAQDGAPYGIHVRESLDHILDAARQLGFPTVNMDGHIGWCEYGQGEEMVAVLGHLDVVPAGDGWSFDPWGGEIKDGRIFGRGTMDDKGPSVAALYALAALRDSGLPIRRRIRVLFGCNEETGAQDMKYYRSHGGEIPVMGFTPDAEYPVINGEKGIINVTFARHYQQSGPVEVAYIHGGTAPNVVPDAASAKLVCSKEMAQRIQSASFPHVTMTADEDGVMVTAQGISAHGSTPWQGENAIGRLVIALDQMPLEGEMKQIVHFLAQKLGMETTGKSAGIYLHDDISGDLSLNWGTLHADETDLSMIINYRYPVTLEYEDCAPALKKLFEDAGFTVAHELHKAKLYVPADSALIKNLLQVYKNHTGIDGQPVSIGGGTYAKTLPNIVAFGPIFPGDEVREHKPDEFIEIPKLMKNACIIADAMYQLAK